jgi:hypothetical protein
MQVLEMKSTVLTYSSEYVNTVLTYSSEANNICVDKSAIPDAGYHIRPSAY